jgi:malate dehydrogenase
VSANSAIRPPFKLVSHDQEQAEQSFRRGKVALISIIGAGRVGSVSAFNILRMRIADVTLVDVQDGLAAGEALDLIQSSPAIEFDGKINGTTRISDIKGSDLVIMAAGVSRKPGMTRPELLERNAGIVSNLMGDIVRYAPDCKIMMVTNPVDVMTYLAYLKSGFERKRIFGMGGILDTLRFRSYIALELNVSREDIRALVVGEHGDHMIPLVDYATIAGIPVRKLLEEETVQGIVERTRTSGSDVISLKGGTVYAPAAVIAVMAEAVLRGRNRVMTASVVPNGEYGLRNLAIGLPVILGKDGVEKIIELPLDDATKNQLTKAANAIRSGIDKLGLSGND